MRPLIIGGLTFIALCIVARWHYVCKVKGLCDSTEVVSGIHDPVQEGTLLLEDSEEFLYTSKEVLPNLNTDNEDRIREIVAQMETDPDINLVIRGAFTEEEQDVETGFFENLGIARADAIRSMITSAGVDEDRISLAFATPDDASSSLISFKMTRTEIEAAQYTFSDMSFSNITFPTASAVFRNPPRQFILYADSIKTYLIDNPDKQVTVIGHTDDQGSEELNYKLGIRRGNSVEYYLRTKVGIKTPITVASKGQTTPVASNDTPEGRRKNRRVQITIQ